MAEQQLRVEDPFHRALFQRLSESVSARMANLATGSAYRSVDDTKTVAEKYAEQVGYITAINDVLGVCQEIEAALMGRPKPQQPPEEE